MPEPGFSPKKTPKRDFRPHQEIRAQTEKEIHLGQHPRRPLRAIPAWLGRPGKTRGQSELPGRSPQTAPDRRIDTSSHRVLDNAAKHIVEISAPFAPLPENSAEDILYITRTWQFLPGNRIRTN